MGKNDVVLKIDATPPQLTGTTLGDDLPLLFGREAPESHLEFDFTIKEHNPVAMEIGADQLCLVGCPTVRLGVDSPGEVHRNPEGDAPEEDILGFSYRMPLGLATWYVVDLLFDISFSWIDAAGNSMDTSIAEAVHLDYVLPEVLDCSLLPKDALKSDIIKYSVTASEVLLLDPTIMVMEGEGIFVGEADQQTEQTWLWTQAAQDLTSQSYTVAAQFTDLAGNVNGTLCASSGT